jgi:hypothetical protein
MAGKKGCGEVGATTAIRSKAKRVSSGLVTKLGNRRAAKWSVMGGRRVDRIGMCDRLSHASDLNV